MKSRNLLLVLIAALALDAGLSPARADSADANCLVRKDGDTKQDMSGPCTFSQRQGYIDIDLRNGETISLSPANQANHFKDQKANKVVRTQASGDTQEYRWDGGKKLTVTFAGHASSGGGSAAERMDPFDTVCGVMVDGKDYSYRCGATDFYSGGQKVRTELRYPDQTIQLTWHPGNRVGLQFEGMVPKEARFSTSEGETNWVFEGKTYYYFSDKGRAQSEFQNFRD
jgi:hypothetical protein